MTLSISRGKTIPILPFRSSDMSNADKFENLSRSLRSFRSHAHFACERLRKNLELPSFSQPPSKQGDRQKRVNSFHLKSRQRSITISTVIYELERELLRGRNFARARASAHQIDLLSHFNARLP